MTDGGTDRRRAPERPVVRLGAPALAVVLTAAVLAVIVTQPPSWPRTTILIVLLVLHLALMIPRGWWLRRAEQRLDTWGWVHQFVFLWGWWAGANSAWDDRESPLNATVLGIGFAALLCGFFWFTDRRERRRSRARDSHSEV